MPKEDRAVFEYEDLVKLLSYESIEDHQDNFFFRVEEGKILVAIIDSDLFSWGYYGEYYITPAEIDDIIQAYKDAEAVSTYGSIYAHYLYCCRRSKLRPQGAKYPDNHRSEENQKELRKLWPLFDACGPEREIEHGNPYRPGEYEK